MLYIYIYRGRERERERERENCKVFVDHSKTEPEVLRVVMEHFNPIFIYMQILDVFYIFLCLKFYFPSPPLPVDPLQVVNSPSLNSVVTSYFNN